MLKRLVPWLAALLIVSGGLLNVGSAAAAAGPRLRVGPGTGHPVDPICHASRVHVPGTRITVTGTGWTAGQVVTVKTNYPATATIGTPTASSSGTWTIHFATPTAPDHAYVSITASDPKGESSSGFYWLMPYTCFHSSNLTTWKWDAVAWDANSALTMKFDGVQVASGNTGANGAMSAVSFQYNCATGTHGWLVTGTVTGIPGGPTGTASGNFTC